MTQIKSFIRWAGGKSWLVPYVKEIIKGLKSNNYFEPFMGGASIFFAIDTPRISYLSDINDELITSFSAVRDEPEKVICILRTLKNDEDSYYQIRSAEPIKSYERAARFLYLNAYSYNGLYRVNRKGKYNVPYGSRNSTINYDRLLDLSKKLANTVLSCQDFEGSKKYIKKNDLVFLDPPYVVSNETNGFIEYNSVLFSLDDQYRLARFIEYINSKGAYYILTNAAHETILEIFKEKGRTITVERNSLIGGKNSYRGKVQEYIFTNIHERSQK